MLLNHFEYYEREKGFISLLLLQTPFELIAVEMEDITAAKDGGVMKKVLKQGTGNVVPDKAIVRGELRTLQR